MDAIRATPAKPEEQFEQWMDDIVVMLGYCRRKGIAIPDELGAKISRLMAPDDSKPDDVIYAPDQSGDFKENDIGTDWREEELSDLIKKNN